MALPELAIILGNHNGFAVLKSCQVSNDANLGSVDGARADPGQNTAGFQELGDLDDRWNGPIGAVKHF